MSILAFDTSNYTTSVALLTPEQAFSREKLLNVPEGSLGLRQQEALFQHVKTLPSLLEQLKAESPEGYNTLRGIAVSTRPRETEDSYMPCFLAGQQFAQGLATVLGLPCYEVSHQQGHFAAALWNLEQESTLDAPFLCWHISGGTTELLLVEPKGDLPTATILGGTTDISAGQLIDRCGKLMSLPFPSGRQLDTMALQGEGTLPPFPVKTQHLSFSLSGMENKIQQYLKQGQKESEVCTFVLGTIALVLEQVSQKARQEYGEDLPLLFCGGVASSGFLKQHLNQGLFPTRYARDNAMGVAVLGRRLLQKETSSR